MDVLIADYSSLIYEYLLAAQIQNQQDPHGYLGMHGSVVLHGGLVLYVPDLDTYMAQRGTYMDIHEIPGEIVKDADPQRVLPCRCGYAGDRRRNT